MSEINYTHQFYQVSCDIYEYARLVSIEEPAGGWKPELVTRALREMRGQVEAKEATKVPEPVVANSVEATLAQRGSRYGDFTDHAQVCQNLKHVYLQTSKMPSHGWDHLTVVQKQALEVIADKIARILTGDPNYDDNWHDIQGYAKLVEDRLPCNVKKESN